MSNWGGPTKPAGGEWFDRIGPAYLVAVTLALLVLGAALVVAERYQLDQASGVPTRLDRFTGQVIACVPQRGCVEFIPAGNPPLATVMPTPKAPPANTGTASAPAAAPPPAPAVK